MNILQGHLTETQTTEDTTLKTTEDTTQTTEDKHKQLKIQHKQLKIQHKQLKIQQNNYNNTNTTTIDSVKENIEEKIVSQNEKTKLKTQN